MDAAAWKQARRRDSQRNARSKRTMRSKRGAPVLVSTTWVARCHAEQAFVVPSDHVLFAPSPFQLPMTLLVRVQG